MRPRRRPREWLLGWCALACAQSVPEAEPRPELPGPTVAAPETAPALETGASQPVAPDSDPVGTFEALPSAHGDVVVWVPSGAERRPLLVATHGAGGAPEWHCAFWAEVVGNGAFVVCPRGRPYDQSGTAFFYAHHHDLRERIESAVLAFEARYAARWTGRDSVYVGYSQGATMGALLLPSSGERFPYALLVEGGYDQWPVKNARSFRQSGGKRAFIACGTATCDRGATRSVRWLEQGGVEAMHATADGAGHTPAGAVGEIALHALAWLVRDVSDWQAFAEPRSVLE